MTPLQWFYTGFAVWVCLCVLTAVWLYYCGSTKQLNRHTSISLASC